MSFNRRGGPDRRPDRPDRDRYDRPPRREGGGDWQSRDRRPPAGDRPYSGGGPRPYQPRPRFDRPPGDEGGMSIRLDPRRLGTLKQLAAEAGVRPGDLVRQWVEERVDAARHGVATPEAATDLAARIAELADRVAALEASAGRTSPVEAPPVEQPSTREPEPEATAPAAPRSRANRVSAKPATERVALHDEMIAVLSDRGPLSAGELAAAVAERGRYSPPRSGKPVDAAMISQRVSNPTYRSRFTRDQGRIGLAEQAE